MLQNNQQDGLYLILLNGLVNPQQPESEPLIEQEEEDADDNGIPLLTEHKESNWEWKVVNKDMMMMMMKKKKKKKKRERSKNYSLRCSYLKQLTNVKNMKAAAEYILHDLNLGKRKIK